VHRRLATLLLLAALLISACGDDGAETDAAPADAAWTFTDDRGVEVALDEVPDRIVAYDNAAAALIPLGVRPVAVFGGSAPEDSPLLQGLDLEGIASVGEVYGELNFEALAAADPDLIVTLFDPTQTGPAFGFLEDAEAIAGDIAPIVALDGTADPETAIGRFEELVTAIGGDVDAAEVAAERDRYRAAVDSLAAAVAANPGVRALAVQAYPGDGIYFGRPEAFPSLRLFREAGLELVEPASEATDVNQDFVGHFWEFVSFELGGSYPADLVLLGNNEGTMDATQILDVPTLAGLPAVQAGQLVTWQGLDRYSYGAFADQLEALAAAVTAADPALAA